MEKAETSDANKGRSERKGWREATSKKRNQFEKLMQTELDQSRKGRREGTRGRGTRYVTFGVDLGGGGAVEFGR